MDMDMALANAEERFVRVVRSTFRELNSRRHPLAAEARVPVGGNPLDWKYAESSAAEGQESNPPPWCLESDHVLLVDIRHLLHKVADKLESRPQSSSGADWSKDSATGDLMMHCECSPASLVEKLPPNAVVIMVFFRLTPSTAGESEATAPDSSTPPQT